MCKVRKDTKTDSKGEKFPHEIGTSLIRKSKQFSVRDNYKSYISTFRLLKKKSYVTPERRKFLRCCEMTEAKAHHNVELWKLN
ncbi:CLUMA_CG000531, isoform A [Clunio marinus]|uniref:CLUMA_CG000531, isoform A n=1 Tax=Clunio marinus TaxID=568069 RepID=A0A1J1HGM1_9DIPT|nr:CLUMA_CG000531, isoform A [Clunio marinus]